nr:iron-containing alcohol dehydrogenase [Clostridium sp. YIM B02506]
MIILYSIKFGCEKMFCGENAIKGLRNLESQRKKAYIVMSGTILKDIGYLKIVTDVLEEADFKWKIYTDVEAEPSFQSILRGANDMKEFEPDWIIGFGGGSAMDAAKAMWVFYENPEYTEIEDVMPPNEIKNLRVKSKIACIPTSAGTGSEATRAALIKDPIKKKKYSIRCMNGRMVPDVAILDPIFTVSMPKSLTAASGMDAITHAIESYVTPLANPYSDAMALASFINGYKNLAECYENGSNMEARGKMLAASCMGGIAFSNCALGLVHSIAHTFGAEYNIPHGLANAVVLPYVLEFNSRNNDTKERYDQLAYYVGTKSLLEGILELRKRIDIPESMKEIISNEREILDKLELLIDKAFSDVCTPFTPVKPTREEMKELILKVYYGK